MSGADLTAARGARDADRDEDALALLDALHPGGPDLADAAHLALDLGRPALAARWWARSLALRPTDEVARLGLAAARWRLGDAPGVRAALAGVPGARALVLLARADALDADAETDGAPGPVTPGPDQQHADPERSAREALDAARHEGDAAALVAAVTLLGERLLLARRAREALHALAQGLRAAEIAGTGADPHLLAVLAAVQREIGSAVKAEKTATKALERSRPRSPARVQALRALGRDEEAWSELVAGELAPAAVPELTRPEPD